MKLEAASLQATQAGRGLARMRAITDAGETVESYEDYISVAGLDDADLKFSDFMADDWVVEPMRAFSVTEAVLASQWNASLAPDASAVNRAPGSPRFQRFLQGLKGAARG